jgi:soluble lytic murein transglycosylase-like protein
VPESLVRRIIHRESRGNPRAVSKGNYGLMQIRLGTARAMGYRGGAAGLLDAGTNMTYAVKYLAGAYRAAGGNADRAVHYYAAGYYYAAKRKGLIDERADNPIGALASAAASGTVSASAKSKPPGVLKTAPKVLKERIEEARQHGDSNVSTSSDMYTGKTDYF